jgi:uncharacterized membrane-anchored protein
MAKRSEDSQAMPADLVSKLPAVALGFWQIKILATTLGETGGDALTMIVLHADTNAHNGGDLVATGLLMAIFVGAAAAQILAKPFNPWIYGTAIVASTTVGTALADFFDRSLGIGYTGGATILLLCVISSLALWHFALGTVDVASVSTPKVEIFYWVTITFSQTLGTALGDWIAEDTGLGYGVGALAFGGALAVLALLYFKMGVSRVFLFWAAFILAPWGHGRRPA